MKILIGDFEANVQKVDSPFSVSHLTIKHVLLLVDLCCDMLILFAKCFSDIHNK